MRAIGIAGLLCLVIASNSSSAAPASFRDFKIYTTSHPKHGDATRIVATMRVINEGSKEIEFGVGLAANPDAGFSGGEFKGKLQPSKEMTWTFELKPPDGFKREVLRGSISFGQSTGPERELYVAVQGTDPANFSDTRVQKITDRAQVVATYAPRTAEAIQRAIDQKNLMNPPGGRRWCWRRGAKRDMRWN